MEGCRRSSGLPLRAAIPERSAPPNGTRGCGRTTLGLRFTEAQTTKGKPPGVSIGSLVRPRTT